ncbi:hypothetical protein ACIRG5_45645 [Lentzea sp. NPDC102401]|uniref:hypothetical protein n=1 Tax=Lentzea sp. NPDC102401 TaxID=3364128 RepID=UPI0037F685E1
MQHSSALTGSQTAEPRPSRETLTGATNGVVRAPFTAPEWIVGDDTIAARWCVGTPDSHGKMRVTTLVTTPFLSFLTSQDIADVIFCATPEFREDPTALQIKPRHLPVVLPATLQEFADTALADLRHAVISGDVDILAFFPPGSFLSTPTTAVAAYYICDALEAMARRLRDTAHTATDPLQAALHHAALLLHAQAAHVHVSQALGEVQHEIDARMISVASDLYDWAGQADDHETTAALGTVVSMMLRPAEPLRLPVEAAITAARAFVDAIGCAGTPEVATDAAGSSPEDQARLLRALDDVRDSLTESIQDLAYAGVGSPGSSALADAAAKLSSAGEDFQLQIGEFDIGELDTEVRRAAE